MRHSKGPSEINPRWDQVIFALLHCPTKEEAARSAGVARSTLYHWLKLPEFQAAYREARRTRFDDVLAGLERNAAKAVQVLVDEMDAVHGSGSFAVIAAATRVLDRAFKAQTAIAVEEELAYLRTVIAALKAGQPPSPPQIIHASAEEIKMATEEQAEAIRLRVLWMTEIGNDVESIDQSLRYNRPQSVAEEQHLRELVRNMVNMERRMNGAIQEDADDEAYCWPSCTTAWPPERERSR